jgi:hypothetical protein
MIVLIFCGALRLDGGSRLAGDDVLRRAGAVRPAFVPALEQTLNGTDAELRLLAIVILGEVTDRGGMVVHQWRGILERAAKYDDPQSPPTPKPPWSRSGRRSKAQAAWGIRLTTVLAPRTIARSASEAA